ncbi:MAG: EamA family transporter [Pseudobutyrivibrio sp.]|nr:EamA family transporter [Pseudobutyrivibrio sp.]
MNRINKGYLYILISAISFATGGLLIKLNTWSPMSINGVRCVFALMLFYPFYKSRGHKFMFNKTVLLGAIANTGMCITFVTANKLTTAANTIVLQFTLPIHIILLLWIFWKKKPNKVEVCTALISFIGILCFFLDNITFTGMVGNILAIVSGFLYAVVFLIKKMPGSDFESSAALSFVINFIIGLPFFLQEGSYSQLDFITIILLGVVQLGLSYVFLAKGLDTVSPVGASLISMAEPILNPILVAVFYGETIGIVSIIGVIIVLGSATFYSVKVN